MTTPAATTAAPGAATTIGLANVVRSEWTKLRSVRSTRWISVLTVLAALVPGAVICARWVAGFDTGHQSRPGFDAALRIAVLERPARALQTHWLATPL